MAFEQLDEFFNYKNQLMEDLLTDETIVKLINENISLYGYFHKRLQRR